MSTFPCLVGDAKTKKLFDQSLSRFHHVLTFHVIHLICILPRIKSKQKSKKKSICFFSYVFLFFFSLFIRFSKVFAYLIYFKILDSLFFYFVLLRHPCTTCCRLSMSFGRSIVSKQKCTRELEKKI